MSRIVQAVTSNVPRPVEDPVPVPSDLPLDPDLLDRLTAYAAAPRGNRAWTLAELRPLFDPAVPVSTIAGRVGVKRAVVTYELVRVRRAGFPVPVRPSGGERSSRTLAIEGDVRAGMTDADVAREHGVSPVQVWEIRSRAGIPTTRRFWSEAERALVIAHQRRHLMGRRWWGGPVRGVDRMRSILIAEGRIRSKRSRHRRPAE